MKARKETKKEVENEDAKEMLPYSMFRFFLFIVHVQFWLQMLLIFD
jgi:hypothetical protein